MRSEIIVVEQMPVIREQLQTIKAEVTEKVEHALSLLCTEETVQEVKKSRAELSKDFREWEEKRKEVKKAVLSPYEQFEAVYKDCITDVFKKADAELKAKIDTVESELKAQKRLEVFEYFEEYKASKNIPISVTFDELGIVVTLSASVKSLKEKAKAFIDKVCDDLDLIETQEYKDEIFYEYKRTKNVAGAIKTVVERHKEIEAAKELERIAKERQAAFEEAAKKVAEVAEPAEPIAPPVVDEPLLIVTFTVTATRQKLIELKEFLKKGDYKYD